MVAMQGNGEIVNDRIIDEIGTSFNRMEIAAAANAGIQLTDVIILFFQIVHNDVVAEVQLINRFRKLCHLLGRMFQNGFRYFLIIFKQRNLG